MRVGSNPLKSRFGPPPPSPITLCIVNHIPSISGYWKESLEVLQLCLNSIFENTESAVDLYIFDNGSCEEVKSYLNALLNSNKINYLLLSAKNIGKIAAWNILFRSVRSEYVAYADNDVYFYSGWEKEHVKIFESFPNVGMVSGISVREKNQFHTSSTLDLLGEIPEVILERGKFLSREYLEDFRRSLGKDPFDYEREPWASIQDIRVTLNNQRAFVGANHFQFLCKTEVIRSFLPLPESKYLGQEKLLDEGINDAGLMRLSTIERFTHHVGNSLTNDLWANKSGFVKKRRNSVRAIMKSLLNLD